MGGTSTQVQTMPAAGQGQGWIHPVDDRPWAQVLDSIADRVATESELGSAWWVHQRWRKPLQPTARDGRSAVLRALGGMARAIWKGVDPVAIAGDITVTSAVRAADRWFQSGTTPHVEMWLRTGCHLPGVARDLALWGLDPRCLVDASGVPLLVESDIGLVTLGRLLSEELMLPAAARDHVVARSDAWVVVVEKLPRRGWRATIEGNGGINTRGVRQVRVRELVQARAASLRLFPARRRGHVRLVVDVRPPDLVQARLGTADRLRAAQVEAVGDARHIARLEELVTAEYNAAARELRDLGFTLTDVALLLGLAVGSTHDLARRVTPPTRVVMA